MAWQVIPANLQEVNHLIPVVSKATWLLEKNKKPVKRLKNVNTYLNLVMLLYLAGVYHNYTNGRNLREIKSLIA